MELFGKTDFDFLGKKWPFIILSLLLSVSGLVSLGLKHGPRYGIDFRGGALMYVRFTSKPPVEKIRAALDKRLPVDVTEVTGGGAGDQNEVIIGTGVKDEQALNQARNTMVEILDTTFAGEANGRLDLNNAGASALADKLRDPLQQAGASISEEQLQTLAQTITHFRDTPPRSGLIADYNQLSSLPGVRPQVMNVLRQQTFLAQFHIGGTEMVGPKIGADLWHQAILAVLYALGGMLVYIAFRFEWIYGVAAVVAVFH